MKTEAQRNSRTPVLLSALVCPGAGQFAQKRWIAGTILAGGFLWGFCGVLLVAGKIIVSFYRMAIEFDTYEPDQINVRALLLPLAIAVAFYLISLFDVVLAQRRRTE